MSGVLTGHPFQYCRLESFPYCEHIRFNNEDNDLFEALAYDLQVAFDQATSSGSWRDFFRVYNQVTARMLRSGRNIEMLRPLLEDALVRLKIYFDFLRLRTRPCFAEFGSVYTFDFEKEILSNARRFADEMEARNVREMEYDLANCPRLKTWVYETLRPLVQGYVGFRVGFPRASIRFAHAERHANEWSETYRHHVYANYHFDQNCYSFPLIIYLNDVDDKRGPFTYVDGSDRLKQSHVLRAFHSAITFRCRIGGRTDDDFTKLGALPGIFRGGDLVGTYTGPEPFQQNKIVNVTGPMGTAVLFEGFQLVHSGGQPVSNERKSLFVHFRYPRYKISEALGKATSVYWGWRTRRFNTPSEVGR